MDDARLKKIVAKYILDGHEDDNADCLHEMDEFYESDEDPGKLLERAYGFYRTAKVTVRWDDDGEAGVHEPRRSGPDSPPAGESRLPGDGSGVIAADASADYSWPRIPEGYKAVAVSPLYVSLDCVHFHEVPDGTSIKDFLRGISGNQDARSVLQKS